MSVGPSKTQISLGIRPVWSVFTVSMKKAWVLSYPLSAQRRLWSDWADAQADLSLRWVHNHIVGFVMSRLNYFWSFLPQSMDQFDCVTFYIPLTATSWRHDLSLSSHPSTCLGEADQSSHPCFVRQACPLPQGLSWIPLVSMVCRFISQSQYFTVHSWV